MDKNSLIGSGIIAIIMGGWLYMSGPSKEQIARNNKIKDSISLVQKKLEIIEATKIAAAESQKDSVKSIPSIVISDSAKKNEMVSRYKDFSVSVNGTLENFCIENENVKVIISNKGAQIEQVDLKKYHRSEKSENLTLFDKDSSRFVLKLNAYNQKILNILY